MPLLPSPPSVKDSRSSHAGSKTMPHPPKAAPAPAPTPAAAPVSTELVSPVHAVPLFHYIAATLNIWNDVKLDSSVCFSKEQDERECEGKLWVSVDV